MDADADGGSASSSRRSPLADTSAALGISLACPNRGGNMAATSNAIVEQTTPSPFKRADPNADAPTPPRM
ncbi:MAG: hypothetical protein Q9169_006546 [Polycauliona sp. 2 TL-2023]